MPSNRFLGPADGLTIRQPTDPSLMKGNIANPPRYQNLAMGGLDNGKVRGLTKNSAVLKPPGSTQRKMPNRNGENT